MTLQACAALVERADPDRFAATMAAPPAARAKIWPIYAFNIEVARAPWVTNEPLIAEMRLQFWRDTLTATTPRAHEVAGPLHALCAETQGLADLLDRVIVARRHDITRDGFASAMAFDAYIEDTSATLLWAAALTLQAPPVAETAFRALGWATGLASYLRAVPALTARGLDPLLDTAPDAIRGLAAEGLNHLAIARAQRHLMGPAFPAALVGWQTGGLLRQAYDNPLRVAEGSLALSEFARRGRLIWVATTGRI
jgi:hypothetical protein